MSHSVFRLLWTVKINFILGEGFNGIKVNLGVEGGPETGERERRHVSTSPLYT